MAFNFDPSKAVAPTITVLTRQKAHTYEGAMDYIRDRLAEMEENQNYTWILGSPSDGGTVVRVTLHSMPIYWNVEEKEGQTVDRFMADGTKIDTRPVVIGSSLYPVENRAEGLEFLKALASGENELMNECVKRAAEALKEVDEIETPQKALKAEMLYNEAGWADKLGKFGEPDEDGKGGRKRISRAKTNKMNQYKQTAGRQLGYARHREIERFAKDQYTENAS